MRKYTVLALFLAACGGGGSTFYNRGDLAMVQGGDLAGPPGADLTVPPGADLAMPPGPDLAMAPSDLSVAISCADRIKNGSESDVDCGGASCPKCGADRQCRDGVDCQSGLCQAGRCAVAATCNDGKQNGNETDTDCGGGVCPGCAVGRLCKQNADCASAICTNGLCKANNMKQLAGSYTLGQGPMWGDDPPVYSCVEACALVFGGQAASYSCSTVANKIDNLAFVDCYADETNCKQGAVPLAENYKKGTTYKCGIDRCACSAYVNDNCAVAKNYCWK